MFANMWCTNYKNWFLVKQCHKPDGENKALWEQQGHCRGSEGGRTDPSFLICPSHILSPSCMKIRKRTKTLRNTNREKLFVLYFSDRCFCYFVHPIYIMWLHVYCNITTVNKQIILLQATNPEVCVRQVTGGDCRITGGATETSHPAAPWRPDFAEDQQHQGSFW